MLALALFLLAGLFVARPFLLPGQRPPRQSERQALLAEKEALLAMVRALDFDATTGKQDTAAYQAERSRLLERAAAVLERLDAIGEEDVDGLIAAAVARLRERRTADSIYCPQCGQNVLEEDKFCPNCGEKL